MPKTKTIIIIAVIIAAIWYYKKRMKAPFNPDGTRVWSVAAVEAAFKKVAKSYGVAYARRLEQLFRLEVGHFEKGGSGQWQKTLSPGMVVVKGKEGAFPFGWSSLDKFVADNPQYKNGWYTVHFKNTSDGPLSYVGFPTEEAGIFFVAWFVQNIRGGRFGYWNSKDEGTATAYEGKMNSISPKFN